jgi:beta-lactamase superfamily II metal-dependent hydrolase
MSQVFTVHVLPAQRGDSFWIEYGPASDPCRMLIDGGITRTGREHLKAMVGALRAPVRFELLVVTHIDLDHIQGIIELLEQLPAGVTFKEIWFNGWDQLKHIGLEPLGVKEGIRLSEILEQRHTAAWNASTKGRAIALDDQDGVIDYMFEEDMKVTVLAPARAQLARLRDDWQEIVEQFGVDEQAEVEGAKIGIEGLEVMGAVGAVDVRSLAESRFDEDDTVPNGSSIALALEFAGKRLLMLGDAYPSVVARSIRRLSPAGPYPVDVVKLAHHGSRNNTDRELVRSLSAPVWVFSSNGAGNTKHPHREAVARVLHDGNGAETLIFNYRTAFNDVWDDPYLKLDHGYDTVYGDGRLPVIVRLV